MPRKALTSPRGFELHADASGVGGQVWRNGPIQGVGGARRGTICGFHSEREGLAPRAGMTTANTTPGDDGDGGPPVSGPRPSNPMDPGATFRQALPHILAMARRRGFDVEEQREIAQNVGVVLVVRRDDYDAAQGTPIEWAIGIAKNVFRESRRAERVRRRVFEAAPAAGIESRPADDLTPEERARAHAALEVVNAALTEQQREICEMTAEGYTAKQVAVILGLPVTTVELRIKEARARLAAVLESLGEDPKSITKVRSALLPFVAVQQLEDALGARPGREDVAADLWEGVLDRVRPGTGGQCGVDDAPPRAAPSASPVGAAAPWSAAAPPAASLLPGPVASGGRHGARVAVSTGQLGVGGTLLFAAGVITGLALAARNAPDPERSRSVVGETSLTLVEKLAATGVPAVPAPRATDTARVAAVTAGPTAAPISTDNALGPATMSESMLLQMALNASPARAVELAGVHAHRFPGQNTGKREIILVRALVALGRRTEAASHAHGLEGTIYEQQARDALEGAQPGAGGSP